MAEITIRTLTPEKLDKCCVRSIETHVDHTIQAMMQSPSFDGIRSMSYENFFTTPNDAVALPD
jgi:hypothetical protein